MLKKIYPSPLGDITLSAENGKLTGLYFEGQRRACGEGEAGDCPVFEAAEKWLDAYFAGARPAPEMLPMEVRGSEFQRRVWELLQEIPYGETISYGGIAARIAAERGLKTMSAQAVGTAVGRNPLSIIIPCHRILAANKAIGGYAGGIERKIWLLRHEGAEVDI